MFDDPVARYQRQLLEQAQQTYHDTPISRATADVFLATPRHLFVSRYRERGSKEWVDVNEGNLQQHLAMLYADHPLTLFGDDDNEIPSTISQPSFVLRMLDLLQLQPGQSVLEVGAGSGWNAALIARLVGRSGTVVTLEIIPEVAQRAAANIAKLGIGNVRVVSGDGGGGYAAAAPYQRVAFTAGTYDIPRQFYSQTCEGGLMLAVIKNAGGGDNLFLLEKVDDHFESRYATPCGFVQLTGKYKVDEMDPVPIESLPQWSELRVREIGRRPFWWGGKGREWFMWRTAGIRSFLGVTEPSFRAFKLPATGVSPVEHQYWGLWDSASSSLVLARDDELISYGNEHATKRLLQHIHRWVDLGMPGASSFGLQVFRSDHSVPKADDQWIVKRPESQFVWKLR